jgi:hypothetical protein
MPFERLLASIVQRMSALMDRFSLEPRRITSPDRSLLEHIILPHLAHNPACKTILFVGCAAYTQWYQDLFGDKEYWTIDPVSQKRRYGATHHVVDSVVNLRIYVSAGYFDAIIMNGVIGFGLNRVRDIEQAVDACHEALASGGILLLGWNDTTRRTPVDLDSIHALEKFREYYFEPLQACRIQAEGVHRHTFSFYQKV